MVHEHPPSNNEAQEQRFSSWSLKGKLRMAKVIPYAGEERE